MYLTSNNLNILGSTRKMDKLKSIMTQMLALQKTTAGSAVSTTKRAI